MFNAENRAMTLKLCSLAFFYNFLRNGIFQLLPFLMNEYKKGIQSYLIIFAFDIPAFLLNLLLIDDKKKGGRIRLGLLS